ncbi:MAG TPA: hypothetical protein VLI04_21535, partial [Nocardioidaceae bacterium]|nr:hypothetical protein [Nocardioidaceae bacterium]
VLADPDLDLAAIGAPASLQTLIAARLDALSAEQRHVVNEASILGASFGLAALHDLCPGIDVDAAVAELIRLQIVTKDTNRLSVEFGQLKFVQSVVRQVAYGHLSRRDRKAGHLAAARYLEAAVDPGTELDAVIAQHFLDAKEAMPGEPDVAELESAAIELLMTAAERAMGLGVPDDASTQLSTALQHATDSGVRAEIQRRLAKAKLELSDWPEAIANAEHATATFDSLGDDVSAARAVAIWARALSLSGDPRTAVELCKERFEAVRQRDDGVRAALELAGVISGAESALGDFVWQTVDITMRLAEALGDAGALADGLGSLSMFYGNTGSPWIARLIQQASNSLASEHQLTTSLARSLVNMTADRIGHDLLGAVEVGRESVSVSLRAGSRNMTAYAQCNLAVALSASGRWTELDALLGDADALRGSILGATAYFVDALAALHRGLQPPAPPSHEAWTSTSPSDVAWFRLADGITALASGDKRHALTFAQEATEMLYGFAGTWDDFLHPWSLAGELTVELKEYQQLDELLALVDTSTTSHSLAVLARHAHLSGLRAMELGRPEDVESSMRDAIDGFTRWGSPLWRAQAQADLGSWLRLQGRDEEAQGLLASARDSYVELGASALLEVLNGIESRSLT